MIQFHKVESWKACVKACSCNPPSRSTTQNTLNTNKKSSQLLLFSADPMCLRPLNRKPAYICYNRVCATNQTSFREHVGCKDTDDVLRHRCGSWHDTTKQIFHCFPQDLARFVSCKWIWYCQADSNPKSFDIRFTTCDRSFAIYSIRWDLIWLFSAFNIEFLNVSMAEWKCDFFQGGRYGII